tara:strand:+ start:76 stop:456 length:381 start_codon:yes stop_codon:yes gene_type:complete
MGSGGGSKRSSREREGVYTRKDMEELDEHWKSNYENLSTQHEQQGQQLEQTRTGATLRTDLHNVEREALLAAQGAAIRRPPVQIAPVSGQGISPVEEAIAASLARRSDDEENPYLRPPRFAQPPGY